MSALHLITRSPRQGLLSICSTLLLPGDGVLFIEDGVYHCAGKPDLKSLGPEIALYCLREDLVARGLSNASRPRIEEVDYARFVDLCCDFDKTISWF